MGSLCCVATKSDRSNPASPNFSFGPHEPYWRNNSSFSPASSRWDLHGLTDGSFYGSSTSSNANVLRSPDLSHTLHWTPSDFESTTRRDQTPKRLFLTKPVHPIQHPSDNARETTSDSADACSWSSGTPPSSIDSAEPVLDSQRVASSTFKCGLCNRYISQKSPWGSRSIMRNRDMPVTGVLPCQHVFHAECLDQSTAETHGNDPPCPVCTKQEGEYSKSLNIGLRLKPCSEEGPSTRQWGCAQVGDCVENAVNVPPRNTMLMMNKNRIRKSFSLRGNSSKDSPRKIKKSNSMSMENQVSLVHSRGKEKAYW